MALLDGEASERLRRVLPEAVGELSQPVGVQPGRRV